VHTLCSLIIKCAKIGKKKLFTYFIDFRKAFDAVDRNILLSKLLEKGINGKFFEVIEYMYQNTFYKVKTESGLTEPILGNIGIKQGDNLSPLLFDIFIDDITKIFSDDCDPVNLCKAVFNCLMHASIRHFN
jgi:hypothetical protein